MSRTTPWLFYQFFVHPNYCEFAATPNDIRLGFNASVAAFQQADIFYAYYKRHDPSRIAKWPKKKDFLVFLENRDPHFLTVQSVATAYKHLYPEGGHYEVGSPMALWGIVYPPDQTEILMEWGSGGEGEVVVRRKNKSEVFLKAALETVVCKLWPQVLPEDWGN